MHLRSCALRHIFRAAGGMAVGGVAVGILIGRGGQLYGHSVCIPARWATFPQRLPNWGY